MAPRLREGMWPITSARARIAHRSMGEGISRITERSQVHETRCSNSPATRAPWRCLDASRAERRGDACLFELCATAKH